MVYFGIFQRPICVDLDSVGVISAESISVCRVFASAIFCLSHTFGQFCEEKKNSSCILTRRSYPQASLVENIILAMT